MPPGNEEAYNEEDYGLINMLDPLGLLGHYPDRKNPIAYSEVDYTSPEQSRLKREMAELRSGVSPERMQLQNALQEQYAQAQPAMRSAPSLTQMQQGFSAMVPAQRRAMRAGASAIANRDDSDRVRLLNLLLEKEDRARQERALAAARIRGAKTFSEDFKSMANAKTIQQLGVLGEQVAEYEPLWNYLNKKDPPELPAPGTRYADGSMEI